MEEKKQIKVSLGAVVSVVIIVILIMLLGVVYYIGIVKNNEKIAELENSYKENIENLENKINELSKGKEGDDTNNKINSNVDDNSSLNQIKLGKHYIQSSETPLDDGIDTIDCYISFLENNKFEAYISWGHSISGTYSISDNNIIKCLINSYKGELSPKQNTYAEISFKINDNTEIEVINASKTYKIKVTSTDNDGNTIITNEDKEMPLSIEKGIKFVLEEKESKKELTPSGFSGSSLIRVVLYSDNTVYVVKYDGAGYDESNIVDKIVIAKNVDTIEANGEGEEFKSIIVKGQELEIIEKFYNWIEFQ